jgi:hypothetical protein
VQESDFSSALQRYVTCRRLRVGEELTFIDMNFKRRYCVMTETITS